MITRTPSTIRYGFVGTGRIAMRHAAVLRNLPGIELVACCDIHPDRAAAFARDLGISSVHPSVADMLSSARLDAVSVCTSNDSHADAGIACLQAGCHVLCEKPLARTYAEGRRLVDAASSHGRMLTAGHYMRFLPQTRALRQWISEGRLGPIYLARSRGLRRHGVPAWGAFHMKSISGGGPLLDTGVHTLDLVMDLMGFPPALAVSGQVYRRRMLRADYVNSPDYGTMPTHAPDVEDYAVGLVRLAGGASITMEVNWAGQTPEDEDYAQVLVGEIAGARIRPFSPGALLEIFQSAGANAVDVAYEHFLEGDPYAPQMEHWVNCLHGMEEPLVKPQQCLQVLQIIDALYASADSGFEARIQSI